MQKNNNFIHHTHFIGIPVSPEMEDLVSGCREWMNGTYGCKSGYGTPPHITLAAPFTLNAEFNDGDVIQAVQNSFGECLEQNVFPFVSKISGFGAFSERTLFVHVEDSENWQKIHSVFMKNLYAGILSGEKKSARKYYPHLTVANRDIPVGAIDEALKHFAQLDVQTEFNVNAVCIYARSLQGGWTEAHRIVAGE